ncbi:hypothetical protein [Halogeometricum limi]|uniref:Uncharacterized protein n=1 Tax=Halogeometricum limi TaxID=555875 RepID=A0A1I6HEA4_9EURY|nr:hypothetical protein [Halogeometricum limi]SFR52660.1 hypothetical protein SAMN04488124_2117 [Halogeometricum limi]
MTKQLPPVDCTASRLGLDAARPRPRTRALDTVVDVVATLAAFTAFAVVAGLFAPTVSPPVTFLALWVVGLPVAFAVPAVAVGVVSRVDHRLRLFACARWHVGCERDDVTRRFA